MLTWSSPRPLSLGFSVSYHRQCYYSNPTTPLRSIKFRCFSSQQPPPKLELEGEFEFERLFSNLNRATLKREPGSVTSSVLLVAGTTVGAGILAIPAVTQESGFLAAAVTCVGCWVYMVVTGLLIAEVNVKTMCELGSGGVSLVSMATRTLGTIGVQIACWSYIFIHYSLLVAYVARSSDILTNILGIPVWECASLFSLLLGSLCYFGSQRVIGAVNGVLVSGIIILFAALVAAASGDLHWDALLKANIQAVPASIPIISLSFVYQLLEADRAESVEFRKMVLAWMEHQETKNLIGSSGSGFSGEVFSKSDSKSGTTTPPLSDSATSAHKVLPITSSFLSPLPDLASIPKTNCMVDHSSDSPSLVALLEANFSPSDATLFDAGVNLPRSDNPNVQAYLGLIVDIWALLDDIQWVTEPSTVVGHDMEQQMVMGLNFSLLDLCGMGRAPFDRGKLTLYPHPLNGPRLTFSVTWNFWVVHGQPRPPEDESGFRVPFFIKVLGTRLFRRGEY